MANYPKLQLFIDGEWKSRDGRPVLNPADECVIGTVPIATRSDLDAALAAAADGFKIWSRTSPAKRAEIMLKAAALMRERIEEIAYSITLEHGKPIAQARARSGARLRILRVGCAAKACAPMVASSPANPASGTSCCTSRSVWSRPSLPGTFR